MYLCFNMFQIRAMLYSHENLLRCRSITWKTCRQKMRRYDRRERSRLAWDTHVFSRIKYSLMASVFLLTYILFAAYSHFLSASRLVDFNCHLLLVIIHIISSSSSNKNDITIIINITMIILIILTIIAISVSVLIFIFSLF